MKKSYLFYLSLFCVLGGVNQAYAQDPETVSLSLGESATRIRRGANSWVTGLVGTVNNRWSLPTSESVKATFGENSLFVPDAGLYWGMCNGNDGNNDDFKNLTSTGFTFYGRQAYTGEYVAQVYVLSEDMASVSVSFNFAGAGAVGTSSFSIWGVTSSAAEMLAASESSWSEGAHTFTANSGLDSGDRLVFIWNSNNAGQTVTISDFSASYTKAGNNETLNYTLIDGVGNEYTGTFEGVKNVTVPRFKLPHNATVTGDWEDDVYKGTVNFPFPVANPNGAKQAVAIRSLLGGTSFLYADDDNNVIADPVSNTSPTEEKANNCLWYIYPALNDGQFTFKLYNVGAQKYIPASISSSQNNRTVLVDEANAGSFVYTPTEIQDGAGFSVPGTQNYLSINSNTADGQNLFLWPKSGISHIGSNLDFKDVATEFSALSQLTVKKFDLIPGATVISPTEYAAPEEINDAIDALETAKTSCDTDCKKLVFLLGPDLAKLKTFMESSESHGEPVSFTYTIEAGKWGTIFPHVNFTKPAEWTLYTCEDKTEKNVLVLTEFNQGRKNKPYLVKTAATEDKTYQIIGYSKGATTANVTEGILTGVIEENTVIPDNSYILVYDEINEIQVFQKFSSRADNAAELNSAYITLPEGTEGPSVLYILEGDIPSSISEVYSRESVQSGKFLKNGTVVIIKSGVEYDVIGRRMK